MAQVHVGNDFLVAIGSDQPAHKFFDKKEVKQQKSSTLRKTSKSKTLNRSKSREIMKQPLLNQSLERKVYRTLV